MRQFDHQPKKSKIVYDYLDKYVNNKKIKFEQAYKEIMEELKKEY